MLAQVWEVPSPHASVLQPSTREVGEPAAREVLVRVRATSLNARDLMQLQGTYLANQRLPVIPCSDAAGEVLAVGAQVTEFKVGDRVTAHALPGWQDGPYAQDKIGVRYGGPDDGVLTTLRLFPADGLVHIPGCLSFVEAATLPVAGLTAWSGLFTHGGVKPGDLVVIQGTGGVSLFALQFALAAGASTVITSSNAAKLERAARLGAHHGVNYSTTPNWSKAMREATQGRGADLIMEVVGDLENSLRAVRAGGTIAAIGVLNGAKPTLNLPLVVMRGVRIQGVTLGSLTEMKAMMAAVERAHIRPVIDRVFSFAEAREAFSHYASGRLFGKIVIEMP